MMRVRRSARLFLSFVAVAALSCNRGKDATSVDSPDARLANDASGTAITAAAAGVAMRAEVLLGVGAQDVNSSGDVAGNYKTGAVCPAAVNPGLIAVVHLDGTRVLLPLPSSGLYCHSQAHAINNSGMVLGALAGIAGVPNTRAIWTPSGTTYTIRDLGVTPDGYRPYGSAGLNNLGQSIGWTNAVRNVGKVYWWSESTGWLPMAVPAGATMCNVYSGINDREEIVGKCTVAGVSNPYYWQNHTAAPIKMPTPAGVTNATPQDINNSGVVVGYSPALRWTPTGPGTWIVEKLSDVGRGSASYKLSDAGFIAGSVTTSASFFAGPVPVYWSQDGVYHVLPVSSGTWGKANAWGESNGVAMTPIGLVAIGSDNVAKGGIRWRQVSPP